MYFCYIDEAGCTGLLPSANSAIQPVFVLCGLIVPESSVVSLTNDFLNLKRNFNPRVADKLEHALDIVKLEIKGSEDLRKPIRGNSRNKRRRAIGFIAKVLTLIEDANCKIVPQIYIKAPSVHFHGHGIYTKAVQNINKSFQSFLSEQGAKGLVIADSRTFNQNVSVSHSVFTQKFKHAGDSYPNVAEAPVFGHSDNHVGLQITDILCSALLFPISTHAYCTGHIQNVHVQPKYAQLQSRYAKRLKDISYRYKDGEGRFRGGITINDTISRRNSNEFFNIVTPIS